MTYAHHVTKGHVTYHVSLTIDYGVDQARGKHNRLESIPDPDPVPFPGFCLYPAAGNEGGGASNATGS